VCQISQKIKDLILYYFISFRGVYNQPLELIEKYIKDSDENGNKSVEIPVCKLNCKNISTIDEIIHTHGFKIDMDYDDFKHIRIKW
jgi:penicillin-binding protein-related factor A (putative recombinase)